MSGFEIGQLILTSKPYAYVLNNDFRGQLCDFCFKDGNELRNNGQSGLRRCSGCQYLFYCNRDCQTKAWETHKYECKLILKAKPKEPTTTLRFIALILLKLKKYGYNDPCEDALGRKVSFQTLMSHKQEIENHRMKYHTAIALIRTLKDYIGQENIPLPSQYLEIYGKMSVNTFHICDNSLKNIGCGLYLGPSLLDHSCQPNASVTFDGTQISVRASKNIPHRDISRIFISYIDIFQLTEDRQKALSDQYFFTCQCCRCTSNEFDELMLKLKVEKEAVGTNLEEFKKEIKKLKEMEKDSDGSNAGFLYDRSKSILENQEQILPCTHICRLQTMEIALNSSIALNQWKESLGIAKKMLEPYRLIYGPCSPVVGVHLCKIVRLLKLMDTDQLTTADLGYFSEAQSTLKLVFGETHPLYQDVSEHMRDTGLVSLMEKTSLN